MFSGGSAVNFSFPKREISLLALMLLFAFAVRLLLFPLQGYQIDIGDFTSWFNTAAQHGIRGFYINAGWSDYPPFNVYIFWVFGSLANAASAIGVHAATIVKLVPNLFDLATAAVIFLFARKQLGLNQSLLAAGLYAFNPAVIFDSAVWGQYDAIYTFFLVASLVLALKNKPKLSAAVFAIALLTKPQGIALLPLVAYMIYRKNGLRNLLYSIGVFVATVFVVILPFDWQGNPISFLSNIYFGAYAGYQYTSINAFNLWGMFGLWVPDGNLYILGWVLFGAFAAFTLFVLHKRFKTSGDALVLFCAFMLFFAFFMLPTRIHERYLFPAVAVLALMYPLFKRARLFYVGVTATVFANEAVVLFALNAAYPNFADLNGNPAVLVVSVINLVLFLYGAVVLWKEFLGKPEVKPAAATSSQPQQAGKPP